MTIERPMFPPRAAPDSDLRKLIERSVDEALGEVSAEPAGKVRSTDQHTSGAPKPVDDLAGQTVIRFAPHYFRRHSDPEFIEDDSADADQLRLPPESGRTAGASRLHSPKLMALPFVTVPRNVRQCDNWGAFWRGTTMWNDEPTEKGHIDYARGRQYARDAIAAIRDDDATSRGLQLVVDEIIDRAFKRRGKGGHLCRKLSSAEAAFLHEICRIAVGGELDSKRAI